MRFNWHGIRAIRGVSQFRAELSPEDAEQFNECLTSLCRDPRVDDIRVFRATIVGGRFCLFRNDQFVMLFEWEGKTEEPEPFQYAIRLLGAARTEEYVVDPMVIWRWWTTGQHGTAL